MKLFATFALLALSSCMSVPTSQGRPAGSPPPAAPERQIGIYLGRRNFGDKDFWIPNEKQGAFAVEFAQDSGDSIGWEVGLAGSTDESGPWTGSTAEVYGGLRKSFGEDNVRPYIGGGLSLINAEWELGGVSVGDDTSLAAYLHGGVQFLVSPTFFLGLDVRTLFGSDVTIAGFDGDADYTQMAVTFGWRF
jgi:hypothetical protein